MEKVSGFYLGLLLLIGDPFVFLFLNDLFFIDFVDYGYKVDFVAFYSGEPHGHLAFRTHDLHARIALVESLCLLLAVFVFDCELQDHIRILHTRLWQHENQAVVAETVTAVEHSGKIEGIRVKEGIRIM